MSDPSLDLHVPPSRLAMALLALVLAAACAPTTARPRPFPLPDERTAARVPPRGDEALSAAPLGAAATLIETALGLRGVPYANGGAGPDGFDCSGFVQYVFWQHQVLLPREVKRQAATGAPVQRDEIAAGDLLFFATGSSEASHVGIALGGGQFIHAPSERGVVRVERLDLPYWTRRYIGARRVP